MLVAVLGISAVSATPAISRVAAADSKAAGPRLVPDDLPGPQPEVAKESAKLDLPPVPAFELPAVEPGFHAPTELRLRGRALLDTQVKVKGYITWVYDCAAAIAAAHPETPRAKIQASIDKDPSLCEPAKFYLGDASTTSRLASIWVVDVPRPGKPGAPARLAVGDYVTVSGTWALQSPHAERNSDGLLVFQAIDRATPPAAPAAAPATAAASEPEITVVTKLPRRPYVTDEVRNASVGRLNACNKAIAARQFDAAIPECQAAIKAWSDNHLAWYGEASAHMAKGEWQKAKEATEHAVALRPDQGMYQLYHGISLYEAERERVRDEQAARDHKPVDDSALDPRMLQLDAARDALRRAAKLAPDLWRAHYYLGRVYRDLDDAKHAAEQFTQAITTHPNYRFGYIALVELYRRWSYLDQAIAVATQGAANVSPAEAAELWYELAASLDAKRDDDKAIEAYSKAIVGRPDDLGWRFQRGQVYFRKRDYANARVDLEAVAGSNQPSAASMKPTATQLLRQIPAKR